MSPSPGAKLLGAVCKKDTTVLRELECCHECQWTELWVASIWSPRECSFSYLLRLCDVKLASELPSPLLWTLLLASRSFLSLPPGESLLTIPHNLHIRG